MKTVMIKKDMNYKQPIKWKIVSNEFKIKTWIWTVLRTFITTLSYQKNSNCFSNLWKKKWPWNKSKTKFIWPHKKYVEHLKLNSYKLLTFSKITNNHLLFLSLGQPVKLPYCFEMDVILQTSGRDTPSPETFFFFTNLCDGVSQSEFFWFFFLTRFS